MTWLLPEDPEVAKYQAALLDILHEGGENDAMTSQVRAAASLLGVELGPIDPALIDVASGLVRQWGRRQRPAP